jgi:hypothetical protein
VSGIVIVVLLGAACVAAREFAYHRRHPELERMFTFGACVLLGIASVAAVAPILLSAAS